MTWHYNCPVCGNPMAVEWARHKEQTQCRKCRTRHYPPTPDEDHFAYITGQRWPPEMEQVVISRRGSVCTAPGCFREYKTLAPRKPISRGGKISVDNLIPLCFQHARDKGDQDYDDWVRTFKLVKEPAGVCLAGDEIATIGVITNPAPAEPPRAEPEPEPVVSYAETIARGYEVYLAPALENRPVVAAPFFRGPVRRLVFDYDWKVRGGCDVSVFLVAWPRGDEPKLESLGAEDWNGFAAVKRMEVERDAQGEGCVMLDLPVSPVGRWTAAVVLKGDGNFAITQFVLAGTD